MWDPRLVQPSLLRLGHGLLHISYQESYFCPKSRNILLPPSRSNHESMPSSHFPVGNPCLTPQIKPRSPDQIQDPQHLPTAPSLATTFLQHAPNTPAPLSCTQLLSPEIFLQLFPLPRIPFPAMEASLYSFIAQIKSVYLSHYFQSWTGWLFRKYLLVKIVN